MSRGASFHLKAVTRPGAAVAHNTRTWSDQHQAPGYLLPEAHSLGAWSVIAAGDVVAVHAAKSALASAKARSMAEYSAVWEGVLNLNHPTGDGSDRDRYSDQVRQFAAEYERITGHRVLTAEVHLDEGRVGADGTPIYNPHAHVTVDRTDDRGRPIRLDKAQLRAIQDLAATVTGLDRGEDARATRRRHVDHGSYRAMARRGEVVAAQEREAGQAALEAAQAAARERQAAVAAQTALAAQAALEAAQARLEAQAAQGRVMAQAEAYGVLRGLMTASGEATQKDYQEAKSNKANTQWVREQTELWLRRLEDKRRKDEEEKRKQEKEIRELSAKASDTVKISQIPGYIDAVGQSQLQLNAAHQDLAAATKNDNWQRAGELTYGIIPTLERKVALDHEIAAAVLRKAAPVISAAQAERDATAATLAAFRAIVVHLATDGTTPSRAFPWHDDAQIQAAARQIQAAARQIELKSGSQKSKSSDRSR